MYTPAAFLEQDREKIDAVIRANSFATLITTGGGGLVASHLPFLYESAAAPYGTLVSHLARANEQWRAFAGGVEVLVIFQGEHGYISPTWYSAQPSVPTWNYQVVHAYGTPRLIEDPQRITEVLERTTREYESPDSPYTTQNLPAGYVEKMARAIVAFEIPITRLEGKFKLSQNRAPEDIRRVMAALKNSSDPAAHRLAAAMSEANRGALQA